MPIHVECDNCHVVTHISGAMPGLTYLRDQRERRTWVDALKKFIFYWGGYTHPGTPFEPVNGFEIVACSEKCAEDRVEALRQKLAAPDSTERHDPLRVSP